MPLSHRSLAWSVTGVTRSKNEFRPQRVDGSCPSRPGRWPPHHASLQRQVITAIWITTVYQIRTFRCASVAFDLLMLSWRKAQLEIIRTYHRRSAQKTHHACLFEHLNTGNFRASVRLKLGRTPSQPKGRTYHQKSSGNVHCCPRSMPFSHSYTIALCLAEILLDSHDRVKFPTIST